MALSRLSLITSGSEAGLTRLMPGGGSAALLEATNSPTNKTAVMLSAIRVHSTQVTNDAGAAVARQRGRILHKFPVKFGV